MQIEDTKQIQEKLSEIRIVLTNIESVLYKQPSSKNCFSCGDWCKMELRCKQFNLVPPIEVLANSCEKYIPF